jgi:hypothetical protein
MRSIYQAEFPFTGGTMNKAVILAVISAFMIGGCAIGISGHHHGGEAVVIVPALPETVELDADQGYYQNGYYYRYQGNVWVYSQSREGPWSDLPRTHYPKQVRARGHDEHDQGNQNHENGQGDNHDRDNHHD